MVIARPPRAPPECEGNDPVTCTIGRTGGSGERHRSEHAGSRGGGQEGGSPGWTAWRRGRGPLEFGCDPVRSREATEW